MICEIDINVEAAGWNDFPGLEQLVECAAQAALQQASGDKNQPAELSILLCDDARIRVLNKAWRGIDKATNVLSFPAGFHAGEVKLLGDVAVAYQTTRREAGDEGRDFGAHLAHLVVHGVLHLLGHDHEETLAANRMETLERQILAGLGYADPFEGADLVTPEAST